MENFFIIEYNTYTGNPLSWGYNMTLGGDGILGFIYSEEQKKLSSIRAKEYYTEEKKRQCITNNNKFENGNTHRLNVKHTEKTKRKMSKSHMGLPSYERTKELNEKISISRKGKGCGENNSMSKIENRKKVSDSKIGRKKYINPITNTGKYCFPGTEPEGFYLSNMVKR